MSRTIKLAVRVKTVENGEKNVAAETQEVALKNVKSIHTGKLSFMGGKSENGIETTRVELKDGSHLIAFARKSDIFDAVLAVATSGRSQAVASTAPQSDADVVDALVGTATADEPNDDETPAL